MEVGFEPGPLAQESKALPLSHLAPQITRMWDSERKAMKQRALVSHLYGELVDNLECGVLNLLRMWDWELIAMKQRALVSQVYGKSIAQVTKVYRSSAKNVID